MGLPNNELVIIHLIENTWKNSVEVKINWQRKKQNEKKYTLIISRGTILCAEFQDFSTI